MMGKQAITGIIIGLIVIGLLGAGCGPSREEGPDVEPSPHQPEAQLKVLSSAVEVEFPTALTFHVEAQGSGDITEIRLRYEVKKIGHAAVISEVSPEFASASKVETSWKWDMRKSSLPPGAEVEYSWLVKDGAGNRLETELTTISFDDDRYQWKTLKAENLSLFWYRGDEAFAQGLMDAALAALDKLAQDTGAQLQKPVKMYIYADSSDLRGALVFPREWTGGQAFVEHGIVAIGIGPDEMSWGRRSIAHELAHLVIYQITFNPYGGLPTWLDEGLAMYAEGALEPHFRSMLQEATSEDELFSVQSLGSSFPAHAEKALLAYAQSYSLVDFLISNYGRDKMLQLLKVFQQGSSYDGALLEVYGFDTGGLDDRWRASLGLGPGSAGLPATATEPVVALIMAAGASLQGGKSASLWPPPGTTFQRPDRQIFEVAFTGGRAPFS